MSRFILVSLSLLALTALAGDDHVGAAVANKARPEADLERDGRSKPEQVLKFSGIQPGMVVADIFSASGYYSEMLSYAVGPKGKVYAQNNKAWFDYVGPKVKERYAENRLPNVINHLAENDNLNLPENGLDGLFMVMTYHDLYHVGQGWAKVDSKTFLAQLFKAVKPGGFVVIIDHAARPGSGMKDAQDLHRIDLDFAKADFEAAGFAFDKAAEFLRNAEDDPTISVFDPKVRGKTDRFVLRFTKPAR